MFKLVTNILDVSTAEVQIPGVLTTREVSRRLGLSRETVCLAIRDGRLVALAKLPGRNGAYLVSESAVVAWRSPGDRLPGL